MGKIPGRIWIGTARQSEIGQEEAPLEERTVRRKRLKRLHNLTPDEKRLLSEFFSSMRRYADLPSEDAVVNLQADGILQFCGNISGKIRYTIEPWVREQLEDNPSLLT